MDLLGIKGLGRSLSEACQSTDGNWTSHTRVFVEAFVHATFFFEMAVKYGKELQEIPNTLPFGWAALLCLFGQLFQKNARAERKAIFRPPFFPRRGVSTCSELRIRVILLALSSSSAGTLFQIVSG